MSTICVESRPAEGNGKWGLRWAAHFHSCLHSALATCWAAYIVHMLPLLLLAERQSIRNTIKSSQSEKFYAARQSSTKKWRKKLPAKKGKLCKQQSLLAPNWRGAIADDDDYLMGRRNHKSASTNNFVCPTLPSHLSSLSCPSLMLVTHMQRRLRVCLRRGLRTFNNAQSDFFRIINLTRVRRAHTWECVASKGRHSQVSAEGAGRKGGRRVSNCYCQSRCHLTVKWTHAWRLKLTFSLRFHCENFC